MIKAIIFDCFGVLTADKWKEFTATLPKGPVLDKARELNATYDAGFITLQEFLYEIHKTTGKEPQLVEELLDNEITKNHSLLNYITELKKTYKIGLLSNIATNWIREDFLTPEEQALFDEMVMSFEVRMTKPDPSIFELTCNKLGVRPMEAIMVDDIDRYCAAAESIGMKSVVYTDFPKMKRELEALLHNSNN